MNQKRLLKYFKNDEYVCMVTEECAQEIADESVMRGLSVVRDGRYGIIHIKEVKA